MSYHLNNWYISRKTNICKQSHLGNMGKYQLRFVVSVLCIVLQCNVYQATPPSNQPTNNGVNVYQIRIPISSINNNGNNSPQCPQCNSNYPFPYYYSQLAQYYSNICNSCKGSLCSSQCSNNNQLTFSNPTNSLSVSLPTRTPGGRTTLTIDTRCNAPTADKPAPDNNGENNIDVVVKVVPIDNDNSNATPNTSAQSKAVHDENGNRITALTTAQEIDPNRSNSTQSYEVKVFVNDVNTGSLPAKTSLRSQILSENSEGDILASKTNSVIERNSEIIRTDGDGSNVTGKSPPASSPPASDSTKPDADKPPADSPPASTPTKPDTPPAKPADTPPAKPADPPADAPADSPPDASTTSVAAADKDGASAATTSDSG